MTLKVNRDIYTDTHCTTEGFPGTIKPAKPLQPIPQRRRRGWLVTALATLALLAFTWMACYLDGCLS